MSYKPLDEALVSIKWFAENNGADFISKVTDVEHLIAYFNACREVLHFVERIEALVIARSEELVIKIYAETNRSPLALEPEASPYEF